ncbi:MAG: hypothetical protein HND52_15880 [Ignavibacteriae bacterium]|nr:hypothetical protein [Ignavibacteriota bacterium]NOG99435.1 hypothetical protein [Ignavibacteriota bacterium]
MRWLTKHASNIETDNLSGKFRSRRLKILLSKIKNLNSVNTQIIDIGGSNYFWETLGKEDHINFNLTLVNKEKNHIKGFKGIIADAANLQFIKNNAFDLCFSNSVIEHLPTFDEQKQMAESILRIAPYHFIQTPAYIFPVEPHFLFPFFHWLPEFIRIKLLQNFRLGWYEKLPEFHRAETLVKSIRIMKKRELKKMFPGSHIITEYVLFLPKSYIVTNL